MATSTVFQSNQSVPFLIRVLWFFLVGWWLSGIFIVAGYLFTASIVGIPIGFWFLNRVPQAQTLRMRNTDIVLTQAGGSTQFSSTSREQVPWLVRALWFPIGLVLGAFWLAIAWALGAAIITLPISV